MSEVSDRNLFEVRARSFGMSERLIDRWIVAKNVDSFGGGTPLEALNEGRLLEVINAAKAFCEARPSDMPRCTCASHGLAAEYRHGGCAYGAELRRRALEDRRLMGAPDNG
jgi:hypothetical protein